MALKTYSLNKANAVRQTTNNVTGTMAVVVSHFTMKVRGVAGLLNSHHGVTFAPCATADGSTEHAVVVVPHIVRMR